MPADDRARILAHHGDDFDKVDFDNPEGQAIATVWATPTDDGWTLHIHQHAAPLALAADLDQLRELTNTAQAAIEEAERSTEADTMDAVFEARDGAVDALRAILAALYPTRQPTPAQCPARRSWWGTVALAAANVGGLP